MRQAPMEIIFFMIQNNYFASRINQIIFFTDMKQALFHLQKSFFIDIKQASFCL